MGAGGRSMSAPTGKTEEKKDPLQKVPTSKPPSSVGDIKKAIPPHCFQRSLVHSFSYVVYDLILVSIMYYVATTYFHLLPSPFCYLAWPIYWICQGCVCTGIWVIAHECGHHAFSDYQWVDDTVGLILHSVLMVPYFSWKYSHRRHHSNTGSLERDEVFVPKPKSQLGWYSKYLNNPLGRVISLTITLTLGWPLYLAFNVSGRPYDRFACHYDPYGPIYNNRERLQIFLSDAGVLGACFLLYRIALIKGLAWLVCVYGVPLLIVNGFLVLITYLQHTHPSLPHYDSTEWDWLRGALATVDRVYGIPLLIVNGFLVLITYLQHTHPSLPHYDSTEWDWLRGALATVDRDYGILNKVFHHITDTHVVHHLFSTMPHYNAMEATKAVKQLLGDYYQFDGTPVVKAMWREAKECLYVEKDEASQGKGIFWYKNKL